MRFEVRLPPEPFARAPRDRPFCQLGRRREPPRSRTVCATARGTSPTPYRRIDPGVGRAPPAIPRTSWARLAPRCGSSLGQRFVDFLGGLEAIVRLLADQSLPAPPHLLIATPLAA